MKFKNKIIESLKIKKPVFYISTNNFCYEEGKRLRETWADYIRLTLSMDHSTQLVFKRLCEA